MKRLFALFLALALLFPMLPIPARAAGPAVIDGEFQFFSGENALLRYTFHYDENWFNQPATQYQHDLTRMSLRLAMAAGDIRTVPGKESAKGYEPLQELMTTLGFDFSEEHSAYPVSQTKEHYDNIGYGIGSKTVTLAGGEECTIVLLAIRGSGYGSEWGGNFRMGSSGTLHQGFSTAANKALTALEHYILAHQASFAPNVKLWVTGYSRAAATANLLAASVSGRIPALTQENVYAFCFACPQNTTSPTASPNIVNVLNPIDLVPKFAMSDWGFRRNGQTYYLPGRETAADYAALKANMAAEVQKILSYQNGGNTAHLNTLLTEWDGQCDELLTLAQDLARVMQNRANYVRFYQSSFMDIMAKEMGNSQVDVNYIKVAIILAAILADEGTSSFLDLVREDKFTYAHYMELCMAWLDSVDTLVPGTYNGYHKAYLLGSANMTVTDAQGRDVTGQVITQTGENGQKILLYPADGGYTFTFTAPESTHLSFTRTDFSLDSGKMETLTAYTNLSLSAGGSIQLTPDNTVTLPEGTAEPIRQSGSEIRKQKITAAATEGGTVSGGGSYLVGQAARVTAAPSQGFDFDGWYLGDTLVCSDQVYTFPVTGTAALTAKFSPQAQEITGSWSTDFTLSAADLGVNTPDARLRCTFTFNPDGTAATSWQAIDLSAFREFYHTLFVNAYYACAYGAGIESLEEIEAACLNSTGMGVSDYIYSFLDSFDINALFTPAPASGSFSYDAAHSAIFTDLPIMDIPSDPAIPNSFTIENNTLTLNAASYGKPEFNLICTK